jgi:predicted ABC-type exoprotein transport system permease subunit
MRLKTEKQKRLKFVKWLYLSGILFLILAALFLMGNYIITGFIFIFIGTLIMIPDYWLFFLKQRNKNERWSLYWFSKFLALPLILIGCIIFFIHNLLN